MRLSMTAAAVIALTAATSGTSHAAGADWVDVAVDRIAATGGGECEVSGWVVTVRDGGTYDPGSAIDFTMDCGRTGADPDAFVGGLSGSDLAAAGADVKVSVRLDGSGRVIDYVGMETNRTDGVSRGYYTDTYQRPQEPGDRLVPYSGQTYEDQAGPEDDMTMDAQDMDDQDMDDMNMPPDQPEDPQDEPQA